MHFSPLHFSHSFFSVQLLVGDFYLFAKPAPPFSAKKLAGANLQATELCTLLPAVGTILFIVVQNRVSYELKNNFEGKHKLVKISENILDAMKILRNRLVSSKL